MTGSVGPKRADLGLTVVGLLERYARDSSRWSATFLALACIAWGVERMVGIWELRWEVVGGLAADVHLAFIAERRLKLAGTAPRTVGGGMAAAIVWLLSYQYADLSKEDVVERATACAVLTAGLVDSCKEKVRKAGGVRGSVVRDVIEIVVNTVVMTVFLWYFPPLPFLRDHSFVSFGGIFCLVVLSGIPALIRRWDERIPDGVNLERRRAVWERWCHDRG